MRCTLPPQLSSTSPVWLSVAVPAEKVRVLAPALPDMGLTVSQAGTDASEMLQLSAAVTVMEVEPPASGSAT